jgi:hypothetical protein
MFKALIGTVLLAATTALYAQTTAPADKGERRRHMTPCAQEKDPAACEARRKEMREKMKGARDKARQACEGKQGDERRSCMQREFCAQSKDPAKCEARVKERMEKHKQHMQEKKSEKK